jgi:hypothetical protein
MPDEKALALLRKKRAAPEPESPDIGVVVREAAIPQGQTTLLGDAPSLPEKPIQLKAIDSHYLTPTHLRAWPSHLEHWGEKGPYVLTTGYLNSPIGSILDRCPYSPSRKQSFLMRIIFDDMTFDLDLPEKGLADPMVTIRELIHRYGSRR